MNQSANLVKIGNTELLLVHYQNQPVITFAMIDLAHQRPEGTAGRNFRSNRERFVEGKHFYVLDSKGLDEIRRDYPGLFGASAQQAILITEPGYLKLVKTFTDDLAWDIQDQLIDCYFRFAKPPESLRAKRSEDPIILKHRQAKSILSSVMGMAKLLGTDEPMARVVAADHVRQHTGIDLSRLLTHNTVETKPLTPTELGKLIEKGARQVNQLLKEYGYAIQNENGDWLPTDKGKPFATCNPYKSPNSSHTGYRTLWYPKIVDELQKTRKPESTN